MLRKMSDFARLMLASNPNTSSAELAELAQDRNMEVRCAVAWNASTPSQVLEELAKDREIRVLLAIVMNPAIPQGVLDLLAYNAPTDYSEVRERLQKHGKFSEEMDIAWALRKLEIRPESHMG